MAIGTEYLYPLEYLARNAVRIYPDACASVLSTTPSTLPDRCQGVRIETVF